MFKQHANRMRIYVSGLVLVLSSFFGPLVFPATASAAVRTTCSATSPSYKEWQTTITYTTAQAFCIKDNYGGWLVWQSDGNIVWYISGKVAWSPNTYNRGKTFKLQSDGNMVIYDANNKAIWASSWMRRGDGSTWWGPGMTATGTCKYYVSVSYDTQTKTHYMAQGESCRAGSGAEFWFRSYSTPVD